METTQEGTPCELKSLLESTKWRIDAMLPLLNEKQRRLYLGAEAVSMGKISVTELSRMTGISRNTISAGMREIKDIVERGGDYDAIQGVRKTGAGRKKIHNEYPNLLSELKETMLPGGLDTPRFQWCGWSLGTIQEELKGRGLWMGRTTVANALTEGGFFYHPSKGDASELDRVAKEASEKDIPLIELEIVGNVEEKIPERVWDFIQAWWNAPRIIVVVSLPRAKDVTTEQGILRIPHPTGYIHWKHRRLSALIRIRNSREKELRCLFWELKK